jgi:prepilin-type N-terminal cleavage/methylation domain-containing protein
MPLPALPCVKSTRQSQRRRGFTLTELAIVLGVIGTILGGIWFAAANIYRNKMVNDEVRDILVIVQNMRSLTSRTHRLCQTFDPVTNNCTAYTWADIAPNLVPAKIFPSDLTINAAGWPLDREGGIIKLEPSGNTSTALNNAFELEFMDTGKTCSRVLTILSGLAPPAGPLQMWWPGGPGWTQTGNIDPAKFSTCTYMSFIFGL